MIDLQKRGEVRLEGDEYRALVTSCYARDNWHCRRCPNRTQLTPHHLVKRSDLRLDELFNLVTLCVTCHNLVEASKVIILGTDANSVLKFRFPQHL